MTTSARIERLAHDLATLGVSVYPEPGAPGRGGGYVYVEAPTFLYESAASAYCVNGRDPRLDTSLVVIGTGTAPSQMLALYDLAAEVIRAVDRLDRWMPSGDATPGDYQGTPAYVVPIRSL